VCNTLPQLSLSNVVTSTNVLYEPDHAFTSVDIDKMMVSIDSQLRASTEDSSIPVSDYVARICLDKDVMAKYHIIPADVQRIVRMRVRDVHVIVSQENEIEWVMRVRLPYVHDMVAKIGLDDGTCESQLTYRTVRELISTTVLSGHVALTTASVRHETEDVVVERGGHREISRQKSYVIDTVGVGLMDFAILNRIQWHRCTSNDVNEVRSLLGIEAAARLLYDEIQTVISFDGTYVYPGHIMLIVDTMCRDGRAKPLNRFGVNKDASSALARSSFEETLDILADAAMFASSSTTKGVSTSVMLGQPAEVGSGCTDVRIHTSHLPAHILQETTNAYRIVKSVVRDATHTLHGPNIEYTDRAVDTADRVHPPYCTEAAAECITCMDVRHSQFASVPAKSCDFRLRSPCTSDDENDV